MLDASSYSITEGGQQTVCAVLENILDPAGLDTAITVGLSAVFNGLASKWTWYVRMHYGITCIADLLGLLLLFLQQLLIFRLLALTTYPSLLEP